MSDAAPPPAVPPTGGIDPVSDALRIRTLFYMGLAGALFVIYVVLWPVARAVRGTSHPDALTWGLFVFFIVEFPLFYVRVFDPARVPSRLIQAARRRGKELKLSDHARTVCAVAVSLAASPAAFGFVLVTMSGEMWRALIFLPITGVFAAVLWKRLESLIREIGRLALS